ncbi:MAG TPA: AAA family ATPase [Burkholderiaceae bacterium]|nr:AAA family ATPase [Burkholderiaceae bacterium]
MQLHLAREPRLASLPGGRALNLAALDAALLAWLALEGPTPRARLAQLLWPDKDAEAARNSLRQRLFKLRKSLGFELVQGSTTLSLANGVAHDLDDADTVLGQTAGEDLAPGEFAQWLDRQRGARRDRVRRALVELCERAEAAKDWDDALIHAREWLALEPLSEDAHRRVMRLHYLAGDRAAALLAFDRCEQVLKDEIGARPSAETLALLATIDGAGAPGVPAGGLPTRVPASVQRPPRLVGRDDAWAALQAAWDAGHTAYVRGEAGMGKTRLVSDFAKARGATLVVGARPGDGHVVYASVSRLLRQWPRAAIEAQDAALRAELATLLPELGAPSRASGEGQRTRLFNAVSAVIDSALAGIDGVVFDDLHFADAASLELLRYVAAQSSRRWLFAARDGELGPAARALVGAVADEAGAAPIDLLPLSVGPLAELVDSLAIDGLAGATVAPALLRHTGGNPMFVLETIKAWLTQGRCLGEPGSARLPALRNVSALIERRIGHLSQPAVQLARCAAVAAPDFSIELASRVLGVRTLDLADPWAELEGAQVLRDGAFAHDLIYESALASVPAPVARQLHAEIAAFLAERGGEPARIAHHWLAAGHDAKALDALQAAAEAAKVALRKREEIELRERACALAERLGRHDVAFDCALVNFEAVMIADRTQVDDALFARLDRLARTPSQRLSALLAQADFMMCTGGFGDGAARAEAAAELARAQGDVVREVEALRGAAACASYSGDSQRAVALLRPVLPRVLEPAADGVDRISYFNDLACCLDNADQPQEAIEFHRRALDLALEGQRLDLATISSGNIAQSLKAAGRVQQSLDTVLQARRYAQAFDDARGAAYMLDMMTLALLRDLGRYAEAVRAGEVALLSMAQNPSRAPVVHGHMAWLWLQLGQHARARQALDASQAQPVPPPMRARVAQLEGRLMLALQQPGSAAAFERAQADAPLAGRTLLQSLVALDHARTLAPAAAVAACEAVAQRCSSLRYAGAALTARLRAAAFALDAGEADRAVAHARAVLDAPADIVADDLCPAERWLIAARAFEAGGRADEARAALENGRTWVQRTAEAHVGAEFRDSFLNRNRVNAELLALAARLAPR